MDEDNSTRSTEVVKPDEVNEEKTAEMADENSTEVTEGKSIESVLEIPKETESENTEKEGTTTEEKTAPSYGEKRQVDELVVENEPDAKKLKEDNNPAVEEQLSSTDVETPAEKVVETATSVSEPVAASQ